MNGTTTEGGPEDRASGSWATESLPLAVRKELLERELDRMGLRKGQAQPGGGARASSDAPQPSQGKHPQADLQPGGASHGD